MVTSATWTRLLPPTVIVVDGAMGAVGMADDPANEDVAALLPEERAAIASSVPKRRFEYAAARSCAHRALARLGFPRAPLLSGPGRDPLWPAGVVGSITHASGWCAAAVARCSDVGALGIDLEPDEALDLPLWKLVATDRELRWLRGCAADRRGRFARLLFSAKETFYKCQYPSTRQLLDFQDVELEVDVQGADVLEGRFSATLLRQAGSLAPGETFTGRFATDGGRLITAMTWLVNRADGGGVTQAPHFDRLLRIP